MLLKHNSNGKMLNLNFKSMRRHSGIRKLTNKLLDQIKKNMWFRLATLYIAVQLLTIVLVHKYTNIFNHNTTAATVAGVAPFHTPQQHILTKKHSKEKKNKLDYLDMNGGDRMVLYKADQQYYINKQEPRKFIVVKSKTSQSKSFYYLIADPASDQITASMLWDGMYEPCVTKLMIKAFQQCDNYRSSSTNNVEMINVDIGANYGWFSLLSANDNFQTFSFEPQSRLIYYLNQSIHINGFEDSIHLYHGAAASTNECFSVTGTYGQGQTHKAQNQVNGEKCKGSDMVRGYILDDQLFTSSDHSIAEDSASIFAPNTKVCVFKADCEGCEHDALKGAMKMITNPQTKPMFFQIEVRQSDNSKNVLDLLNMNGYTQCHVCIGHDQCETVEHPKQCSFDYLVQSNYFKGEYIDIMMF